MCKELSQFFQAVTKTAGLCDLSEKKINLLNFLLAIILFSRKLLRIKGEESIQRKKHVKAVLIGYFRISFFLLTNPFLA